MVVKSMPLIVEGQEVCIVGNNLVKILKYIRMDNNKWVNRQTSMCEDMLNDLQINGNVHGVYPPTNPYRMVVSLIT